MRVPASHPASSYAREAVVVVAGMQLAAEPVAGWLNSDSACGCQSTGKPSHGNTIGDPLADMPTLLPNPLPFQPTNCYMTDHHNTLHKVHCNFLMPDKLTLMDHFMSVQNKGFAWTDAKCGRFRTDFFPPIDFPVVPHTPWVQRNIPIPHGIYDQVCEIVCKKIDAGVYTPSNSSY